ncbi:hypothetical protein [Acinetobacter lwoffii]|uniref:hypothetical protein n=1 Tax=Acinetobacter lwoffii TaxID=28090 RepID=UPI002DBD94B3|nr:hypothetical protein [Acinetobacter lwoffii]MEB6679323.1 hypothetical protein [Acinetobacter lwoffii]
MAELGITGVSGLCEQGMDAIMQIEYSRTIDQRIAYPSQLEVYVSDIHQVNRSRLPRRKLAKLRNPSLVIQAEKIAARYHPNWNNCSTYAKKLLSQNAHIIFGYNLDKPIDAVITWCELDNFGQPQGGTATALKMAWGAQIPVFNLYQPNKAETLGRIKQFLLDKKVRINNY